MINPNVQAWLGATGYRMQQAAESGDSRAMYQVLTVVAGEVDKYISPARLASERITLENEGILN
jgi:hypothetical protein